MKVLLVCSSGGHFLKMHSLRDAWKESEAVWVTFPAADTRYLLRHEKVYWAYYPTNRSIINLFRNFALALKLVIKEKPAVVISTGAGVGVPFLFIGKLYGIKTIFIESLTRITSLSLSGKLVYPIVSHFIVQWPSLAEKYKKAVFRGQVG